MSRLPECGRLLVCGSREYYNYEKVKRIIEQMRPDYLIFGDCRGVDTLAHTVAHELDIEHDEPYIADWTKSKKGAGAIRNKEMLKAKPDVVAAIFDDNVNKGTTLMSKLASDAGVPVIDFFVKSEVKKPYVLPKAFIPKGLI